MLLRNAGGASSFSRVFDDLALLDSVVDWDLMFTKMWANTPDDHDRMRRRMAEFLVHERVPVGCVQEIVVRRETMKDKVGQVLATHGMNMPVRVRPGWYFENV